MMVVNQEMSPSMPNLVAFALRGLEACWMSERNCFSHAYRLTADFEGNVSIPSSDYFYTLNVLLGFSRLPDRGRSLGYDREAMFRNACRQLALFRVPVYAYGMAAWAGAELEFDLPEQTRSKVLELVKQRDAWKTWTAQDVGMMISGSVAQARGDGQPWKDAAGALSSFVDSELSSESGLFFNQATGLRRRYSSFATAIYLSLAKFHVGEAFGDDRAIRRATKCLERLIALQGPQGEWPWFYDALSGNVVDNYPIFSVHQDGMAPALLHHGVAHGVVGARDALVRGFRWITGDNQLGLSMLVPEKSLILRAIMRRQRLERLLRGARAMGNGMFSRQDKYVSPDSLTILRECRSYHLGWIVWSFGGRSDFTEIADDPVFSDAVTRKVLDESPSDVRAATFVS